MLSAGYPRGRAKRRRQNRAAARISVRSPLHVSPRNRKVKGVLSDSPLSMKNLEELPPAPKRPRNRRVSRVIEHSFDVISTTQSSHDTNSSSPSQPTSSASIQLFTLPLMESASSLTQTVSIALTREGQLGRSLTRSECDKLAEESWEKWDDLISIYSNAKLGSNLEVKKPTGRKAKCFECGPHFHDKQCFVI